MYSKCHVCFLCANIVHNTCMHLIHLCRIGVITVSFCNPTEILLTWFRVINADTLLIQILNMASDAPQPDITSIEACMLSPAWGRFIYQSADRLSVCCNEVQQLMNPDITPNNREHSRTIHLMSYSNHTPAITSESMTWRRMQTDSDRVHITRIEWRGIKQHQSFFLFSLLWTFLVFKKKMLMKHINNE